MKAEKPQHIKKTTKKSPLQKNVKCHACGTSGCIKCDDESEMMVHKEMGAGDVGITAPNSSRMDIISNNGGG